jgi:hypothetical protein
MRVFILENPEHFISESLTDHRDAIEIQNHGFKLIQTLKNSPCLRS